MENSSDNSLGIIIGIILIVIIALVGWFAYSQGFFNGAAKNDTNDGTIKVEVTGGSDNGQQTPPTNSY